MGHAVGKSIKTLGKHVDASSRLGSPQHAALFCSGTYTRREVPYEAFNRSVVSVVRYAGRHDDEHSELVALSETSTQTGVIFRFLGMHFRYALGLREPSAHMYRVSLTLLGSNVTSDGEIPQ
jgi:hypothetical protein